MWLRQTYRKKDTAAAEDYFLCSFSAAFSALLLSVAHFHTEFWFILLFALVPYLHQLRKSSWRGVLLSSISIASIYSVLIITHESLINPGIYLLKFGLLNLIFILFGSGIKLIKKSIWFNSVFIAALWLPLEFLVIRYIGLGAIFALPSQSHDLVCRLATIFGFLTISFFIILANSVILLLFDHIFVNGSIESACDEFKSHIVPSFLKFSRFFNDAYGVINSRAPPELA